MGNIKIEVLKGFVLGIIAILFLGGIFVYQQILFNDGKLHVVFCNVGQGDGIFIRTPEGMDIIVDGGPDDSILSCLSNHMPFWDRDIELMLLTHPHADHLNGLLDILPKYKVTSFVTEKLENDTAAFRALHSLMEEEKIHQQYLFAGNKLQTSDGILIRIVGPTQSFLAKTSPNGKIGESREFASLETLISFGSFSVLLTGDSQAVELKEAIPSLDSIDVLQVPHHGSKTGLDQEILDTINPKLAVISVGKNRYGHPSKEAIKILRDNDIKILRTDQSGEVEIVSDGKKWWVVLD